MLLSVCVQLPGSQACSVLEPILGCCIERHLESGCPTTESSWSTTVPQAMPLSTPGILLPLLPPKQMLHDFEKQARSYRCKKLLNSPTLLGQLSNSEVVTVVRCSAVGVCSPCVLSQFCADNWHSSSELPNDHKLR